MSKALVIVESQAKAKTINKYLGSDYLVKSSFGHICDLPTNKSSSKKSINFALNKEVKKLKKDKHSILINRIGINPWNNWQAKYKILPGKEKVVSELKRLAEKVDHVYLATDLDREGEAIAWHLREAIGGDKKRYSRIVFNEITKNAILQAFETPSELNIDRVNAQKARRFMDRLVGYMISPLLWKKISRGLSAGRVQSVAVRLIVEREREIKAFVSEKFWKINANVATLEGDMLSLRVTHKHDKPFRPESQEEVMAAISILKKARYQVIKREDKLINSRQSAPFITSTLQQAASTSLRFSVKKTMLIAQHLYEAGYITYMRTDSTNLSQHAVSMVRDYIRTTFGNSYLPENAIQYANTKHSQEAHEAIRPSDVSVKSEALKDVGVDEQKLYQLIWCQFVACQMVAAKYDSTTLTIKAENFCLRAHGRILRFDGWTKVMSSLQKENENLTLPSIEKGDELLLTELIPEQRCTKPPCRFSEASLVRELEKRSIGRPSTYASIITTIQDRGYVRIENHQFHAEKIGEIVTDRLKEHFCELMSYDFTAKMEDCLDEVAKHQAEWKKILDSFFINLISRLEQAEKDHREGGMQPNQVIMTSVDCPTCGRNMGIRTATTGVFLSCSGYTMPSKERCKTTIHLLSENEVINILEQSKIKTHILRKRILRRCKKCNTIMDSYRIDPKYKIYVCGNNPICDGYEKEEGDFYIKGYDDPLIKCEKCGHEMYPHTGRFGKYMACVNDKCKNTRKIFNNGEVAPPKEDPVRLLELTCKQSDAYFVLRNGVAGIFLAANTFPKSRETRAPLVEELHRFRSYLPEKLHYLADAPQHDENGNKTVVRFSRKTKQQYISGEKKGKSTGWSAFFINGKWVVNNK